MIEGDVEGHVARTPRAEYTTRKMKDTNKEKYKDQKELCYDRDAAKNESTDLSLKKIIHIGTFNFLVPSRTIGTKCTLGRSSKKKFWILAPLVSTLLQQNR